MARRPRPESAVSPSEEIARRALQTPEITHGLRRTIASMNGEFDPDVADAVLERVADGLTLSMACLQLEIPQRWVRTWVLRNSGEQLAENPPRLGMRDLYVQARQMQAESWSDEIVEIADDVGEGGEQAAKLRIDTRKWLMGRADARYLEKSTTVLEGGDRPVRVAHSLDDLRHMLQARGLPTRVLIDEDEET